MRYSIEAESALRQAGRALDMLAVIGDGDARRVAQVAFRLASRIRGNRTGVHP